MVRVQNDMLSAQYTTKESPIFFSRTPPKSFLGPYQRKNIFTETFWRFFFSGTRMPRRNFGILRVSTLLSSLFFHTSASVFLNVCNKKALKTVSWIHGYLKRGDRTWMLHLTSFNFQHCLIFWISCIFPVFFVFLIILQVTKCPGSILAVHLLLPGSHISLANHSTCWIMLMFFYHVILSKQNKPHTQTHIRGVQKNHGFLESNGRLYPWLKFYPLLKIQGLYKIF